MSPGYLPDYSCKRQHVLLKVIYCICNNRFWDLWNLLRRSFGFIIARFHEEREIKQRRLKKWWLSGICSQAKYIKHLSLAKFAVIKVISKYWFSTFTEWSNKVKIRFNNKVLGYKILSFSIVTSTCFSLFDSQLSVCLFFHCCRD